MKSVSADRRETPVKGFIWKFVERCATQGTKFIIQIILARLLLPAEYGIIALISVFIALADTLVQSGLNTALIQKKDADQKDFATATTASFLLAVAIYLMLFFLSPIIASIYREDILVPVIRVLGLVIFIGAVYSIQIAYLSKKLLFRYNFISSLIATLISGAVSVWIALLGYGVWAMVIQQLLQQLLSILILSITLKWFPKIGFSIKRFKQLFSFGWKIMAASIVALLTEKVYSLIIGKSYSSEMLGYYDRGHQFPYVIMGNVNMTINSVLLPVLSEEQHDRGRLKELSRKAVTMSSFFILPAMAGLIAVAEPLVRLLLTDKWLMCVPFLQLECLFYATLPMASANGQVSRAMGRSDITLWMESVKTVLTILCFILFYRFGIYLIVAMRALISLIIVIASSVINRSLIGYRFSERISDVGPSLILAAVMGGIVYLLAWLLPLPPAWLLPIQLTAGIVIYFGLSWLFRIKGIRICSAYLKKTKSKGVSV